MCSLGSSVVFHISIKYIHCCYTIYDIIYILIFFSNYWIFRLHSRALDKLPQLYYAGLRYSYDSEGKIFFIIQIAFISMGDRIIIYCGKVIITYNYLDNTYESKQIGFMLGYKLLDPMLRAFYGIGRKVLGVQINLPQNFLNIGIWCLRCREGAAL